MEGKRGPAVESGGILRGNEEGYELWIKGISIIYVFCVVLLVSVSGGPTHAKLPPWV